MDRMWPFCPKINLSRKMTATSEGDVAKKYRLAPFSRDRTSEVDDRPKMGFGEEVLARLALAMVARNRPRAPFFVVGLVRWTTVKKWCEKWCSGKMFLPG